MPESEATAWATLPRSERTRIVTFAVLRMLGVAVVLLVGYLVVATYDPNPVGTTLRLVAGIVILVLVVFWQLRRISRAAHPAVQAIEAVVVSFLLLIVVFAGIYVSLSDLDASMFTQRLEPIDGLYFTISTLATVGFGDIAPALPLSRALVSVQIILDLVLLGVVVRLFLTTARTRRSGSN